MHKVKCVHKQIIRVSHLRPFRILAARVFTFTPEVEVRPQAPVFNRTYPIKEGGRDSSREVGDCIFMDIDIVKKDTKKQRRFAS